MINFEFENGFHLFNGKDKTVMKTKPKEFNNYISTTRTLYRMMWFVDFLKECFGQVCTDKEASFATCAKNAYNISLGPHHNFMI